MKIEDLRPDQLVSVAMLVLIVLSILALSVLSAVYLSVRISRKQKFNVAQEPLATVGFIDCVQAFGLVLFLIITAQAVMFKIDPSLAPKEKSSEATEASEVITTKVDSKNSERGDAVHVGLQTNVASLANGVSLANDAFLASVGPQPYMVAAPITRSDLESAKQSMPLSEPVAKALKRSAEESTSASGDSEEGEPLRSGLGAQGLGPETSDAGAVSERNADAAGSDAVKRPANVVLSAVGAGMQLLAVFLVYFFIRVRTGCSSKQLGLNWKNVVPDIGIGLWVLFLTLPVLLVFSAFVNQLTEVDYNHPVIDMMRADPWSVGLVAWMAVIVAPISEEFFFRTMLIGLFESIHYGRTGRSFFFGWMYQKEPVMPMTALAASLHQTAPEKGVLPEMDNTGVFHPPWWPSILSGILFGLAHFSYGVSWIPLIVFGIVLGRVYQLRQSLVTCVTIHLVFNAINLLNLWLSLDLPRS